jgi:hypothetical protein
VDPVKPFMAAMGAVLLTMTTSSPIAQTRPDRSALERELADARAKWTGNRPANYEFVLNIPTDESPWQRRFGIFRVMGDSPSAIVPLTGSRAFQDRTTIDALFDLVATRIADSPADTSPYYDLELGYVGGLFSPDFRAPAFRIPVWRAFKQVADVREPFALVEHVNHCGAVGVNRTDLHVCPDYAIAIWGDGTVVYNGPPACARSVAGSTSLAKMRCGLCHVRLRTAGSSNPPTAMAALTSAVTEG